MEQKQADLFKKFKWILIPLVLFMTLKHAFVVFDPKQKWWISKVFEFIDSSIWFIVLGIVAFGVLALMQNFFSRNKNITDEHEHDNILIELKMPYQWLGNLIFLILTVFMAGFMNFMLFNPEKLFEQEQIESFELFEKALFVLFYVICHFLLIVLLKRMFSESPPVFIASDKGFRYEPAGISSGWILWEDILEAKESYLLSGNTQSSSPREKLVLGIKLKNPEEYRKSSYSSLLNKLAQVSQALNNYQTDGVADIVIDPYTLGKKYEEIKSIILTKSQKISLD
jgi:hypothetical protein